MTAGGGMGKKGAGWRQDALWWALFAIGAIALVASGFHFAADFGFGIGKVDGANDEAFKYLGVAILVVILLRAGPLLKAKLFGYELEFESLADRSNAQSAEIEALKTRLTLLEKKCGLPPGDSPGPSTGGGSPPVGPKLEDVIVADDPQKKRFGGRSKRAGKDGAFELNAEFFARSANDRLVNVRLSVKRTDDKTSPWSARFYLHPTFGEDPITVASKGGVAELTLLVYGGFTVGVWIEGTDTLLELDLAEMRNAPRVIREL